VQNGPIVRGPRRPNNGKIRLRRAGHGAKLGELTVIDFRQMKGNETSCQDLYICHRNRASNVSQVVAHFQQKSWPVTDIEKLPTFGDRDEGRITDHIWTIKELI